MEEIAGLSHGQDSQSEDLLVSVHVVSVSAAVPVSLQGETLVNI